MASFTLNSLLTVLRTWQGKQRWLFSIKAFCAAMSALYIALALGLDHPYWAMATVYLVSSPLDGATRSKSAYRVAGTLLGAAAAVVMVPPLVNEPLLLMAAISFWTAALLYLSQMQRGPRSYVFLLAAFTLPIVALPTVTVPTTVFDVALLRVEETVIGIVCASVIGSLVFPARVVPVMNAQTRRWLADAELWIADMLSSDPRGVAHHDSRHRLASDIGAIGHLIDHLTYETDSPALVSVARDLHERMTMLLPVLSALAQAVGALREHPAGMPVELAARIDGFGKWTRAQTNAARRDVDTNFSSIRSDCAVTPDWHGGLVTAVERHLNTLVDLWGDCLSLQQRMSDNGIERHIPALRYHGEPLARIYHHDHLLLLFQAASAGVALFFAGVFWIVSGWENGAGPVAIASATISLLSSVDQPRNVAWRFVAWSAVCLLVVWFYLFVVLPWAHDFEALAALLAVPYILIGSVISRPGFNLYAVLLSFNAVTFANAQTFYDTQFDDLFNTSLATFAAMACAPLWYVMTRPFGQRLVANRLIRANWRDIAHGADRGDWVASPLLRARMFDRLVRMAPMLSTGGRDTSSHDSFAGLQVGYYTLALQRDATRMAPSTQQALRRVLQALAIYSEHRERTGPPVEAQAALAKRIDEAYRTISSTATPNGCDAVAALVGLRLTLFPKSSSPDGANDDAR